MPIDRVPFFTNEQYVSDDLNQLQRAFERALEDVAGYGVRAVGLSAQGEGPSNDGAQPPIAFVGGLAAQLSGSSLEVGPGMLLSTQVGAPDNLTLSGAYLVTNPAAVVVALPSPVVDTWYVIAARPTLADDPPTARRVWDVDAGQWVSTGLVKRRRTTMAFDVLPSLSAGQLPLVYPDTSVPLWAVLRPAGGGLVLEQHVIDLRPARPLGGARSDASGQGRGGVDLSHNQWSYTIAGLLQLGVHVRHENVDLHAVTTAGGFDPLLVKNPADAAPNEAGEWWYLYLARYAHLHPLCAPRHAQLGIAGLAQQGLVILSKVAPRHGDLGLSRVNGGALLAAAPFNTGPIPAGDAVCFGSLFRFDGFWAPAQGDGDHVRLYRGGGFPSVTNSGNFLFAHGAPRGVRAVHLLIKPDTPAGNITIKTPDSVTDLVHVESSRSDPFEVELLMGPLGAGTQARLVGPTRTYTIGLLGYRI